MRKDKQKLRVSFSQGLNSAAVWTLRIVGSVIFCTLSWYALRYTQYIPQFQTEIPVNMHDSVSGNILVLGLAMFGMMCYFLFAVKKGSNILQHMLAATMIGGFFFSIIWEAKARYVLPYYIIMYPMAVLGYGQLFQFVALVSKRLHGKKFKTPILSSMAESNKHGMGV